MIEREELINKILELINECEDMNRFVLVMSKDIGDSLGDIITNRKHTQTDKFSVTNGSIIDGRFEEGKLHVLITHNYAETHMLLVPMSSPRPIRISVTID